MNQGNYDMEQGYHDGSDREQESAPQPPSARRTRESYTSHLRQTARTSTDGSCSMPPRPRPRSEAFDSCRNMSPSPSASPSRTPGPRPLSSYSLQDHQQQQYPRSSFDRWSYDKERMPSSPYSRPQTPTSYRPQSPPAAYPRPRPQSEFLSVPGFDMNDPNLPSCHRRVVSTGDLSSLSSRSQQLPPPLRTQISSTAIPSTPGMSPHPTPPFYPTPSPNSTVIFQIVDPDAPNKPITRLSIIDDDLRLPVFANRVPTGMRRKGEEAPVPGCCGIFDLGTVKSVGGTIAAWVTGVILPVTFGLVKGCLTQAFK